MRSFLVLLICGLLMACTDASSSQTPPTTVLDTIATYDASPGMAETHQDADSLQDQWSDALIEPGDFGSPCLGNSDCNSGFCIEASQGKVCSRACVVDCPSGFQCANVSATGPDVLYICVSRFVRLCDPCKQHSDCNAPGTAGNLCVSQASAGSFCGVACLPTQNDCPTGYTCQLSTDAKTGVSLMQCLPKGGALCTCSPRATLLGLSTACANKNFYGTCAGERTCTVQGLTNCIGQIPDVETCNNLDDNCDGQIDNVDASFLGSACKRTSLFGTCTGKVMGCAKGSPICDAPEPTPEACNGMDDNCNGVTDEGLCDDGNECTTDACNTDGSCKHTKLTGTACNDQNVCTAFDQCASGVCLGGSLLDCNDNDPCSIDSCDPFTGCKHLPASEGTCADDGNACTQDVCKAGSCTHPSIKDGAPCATDGEVCTTDICKSGACEHLANTVACNDGNPCTLNDTCKDKTCSVFVPKVCTDNNPCTLDECDPKIGCVFKPNPSWKDGAPCPDDGNACTDDICKGSTCAHVPIPNCN
ncbi:hypothetical protein HZA85_01255 [Candidatus Uhrbacteria bacterium]|nr:hypothetical protein [Candidatus Uhrbacteria bacterium]